MLQSGLQARRAAGLWILKQKSTAIQSPRGGIKVEQEGRQALVSSRRKKEQGVHFALHFYETRVKIHSRRPR